MPPRRHIGHIGANFGALSGEVQAIHGCTARTVPDDHEMLSNSAFPRHSPVFRARAHLLFHSDSPG